METRRVEFLLVEDNPADVRLTKEALKEGTLKPHLSVASDGVEALAFLRREGGFVDAPRPDLILLDLNLPRKDGREVLAEVKNDPELRRIPIVVLTTSQADEDIQHSYDLHANCFVTKALNLEQFVNAVHSIETFWLSTVRLPSDQQRVAQAQPAAPPLPQTAAAPALSPAAPPPLPQTAVALPPATPMPAQPAPPPAVQRTPSQGSVSFKSDGAGARAESPLAPTSAAKDGADHTAAMRILLVEDNRADARLVREMLVDTGIPFELAHVMRLAEAIDRIGAGDIDVILLDLSLPDGEGLAMVGALRDAQQLPIVVMSGHNDESLAVKGVREGAQDYLVKGRVDGEGLVRALRYAIERQHTEDRLRYVAHHDPLTGLPNRALLYDRLHQQLAQARRHDHPLAVLFLDLDRFKLVNDTCGHDMGDRLLQEVADRLTCCTRGGDTVARLGGDEFVLLLPDLAQPRDAATVAEKILAILADPFLLGKEEATIGVSIGISVYPSDGIEPETLIKAADTALYYVKDHGRNGYAFRDDIGASRSPSLPLTSEPARAATVHVRAHDDERSPDPAEPAGQHAAWPHARTLDAARSGGDAPRHDSVAMDKEPLLSDLAGGKAPGGASARGRGTVLVIDDDPFIVELLEAVLEEKGYHVLAALGAEALALAREARPDIILTDLMMPAIDGVQLSRLLRADPATTAIPIVAMSAQMNLRATAELIPVDARLAKPFDLDLLYRTVAQWITAD